MQFDPTQGGGISVTRSVSQWERALLAQWFAGTDRAGEAAVTAAYVSDRSQDDPRRRNMIVIAEQTRDDTSYLIHRPLEESIWTLTCGRTGSDLSRLRTLPEALNTIRPHRTAPEPSQIEERFAEATSDR